MTRHGWVRGARLVAPVARLAAPVLALTVALGLALASARPAHAKGAASRRPPKTEDTVAGGTHWRIRSEHGPIHVWVPAGYDRATAGTVIYVHGYWTDVDGAWTHDHLAGQFRKSGQNALFIVPEAPSNSGESVRWTSLVDLRRTVARANIRLPDGPTIVVGHSGAFRTLADWVDNRLLAQVVLLDAMYGRQDSFEQFIGSGKRAAYHKLLLIGSDTAEASRSFAHRFPFAVVRDRLPASYDAFSSREKHAKLLYVRSQYSHAQLAAGGTVLPLVLRLTPLAHL